MPLHWCLPACCTWYIIIMFRSNSIVRVLVCCFGVKSCRTWHGSHFLLRSKYFLVVVVVILRSEESASNFFHFTFSFCCHLSAAHSGASAFEIITGSNTTEKLTPNKQNIYRMECDWRDAHRDTEKLWPDNIFDGNGREYMNCNHWIRMLNIL